MTADRAAKLAVAASPSMAYARALSLEAEASVGLARTGLYPRLELEARYTHVDGFEDGQIDTGLSAEQLAAAQQLAQTVTDPAARQLWLNSLDAQGPVTFEIPRNQYAFEARILWPVSDVIFAVLPGIEAAEERVAATDHAQRATRSSVELRATEAFYTLAKARGTLAVAQASERVALAQRVEIQAAVDAGFLTMSDSLAATARVANAGRAVAAGEAAVAVSNGSLRLLIGVGTGPAFGVRDAVFYPPAPREMRYRVLVKRALSRRADLAALRASLSSQRAATAAIDAAAYPHLGVFGGVTYANPNPLVIPPTAEFAPSWQVGAALTWSPNDLLTSVNRSDVHAAQRAATEARIQQQEMAVRIEVRQALEELRAAKKARVAADESVNANEAAHASRLAALRGGAATSTEVFAAAAELDHARLALLDAAVAQRMADAKLRHAVAD
ncbi:MAG: TolC family protein [Myxococcales bacterium]|nr:TolC family protein [Myxococcales bacterium]